MISDQDKLPDLTGEDHQLVEIQLTNILTSKGFKSAKQLKRFLKYVVDKTIEGEEERLAQYQIGLEALSFSEDFDPEENPAVRIIGGRLRQRLEEYYENEGGGDELIISMPKGGYKIAFEKKLSASSRVSDKNITATQGPRLALISFTDRTQSESTNRFLLQSTDILATELSRFLLFNLLVRNPYADKDQSYLPSSELITNSEVDYHLNLFLQEIDGEPDRYRLIYRLVHLETDNILWSDNYVITGDPIDQQDFVIGKIAATVTDNLQGIMSTHWSRRLLADRDNVLDHHKVLVDFREFTDSFNKRSFINGVNTCLEALSRNPNDVIALILYAEYCRREYTLGYDYVESPLEKGKESIETAIRLSPASPAARFVYGQILFCLNELERCVEEIEIVRSISKNSIVVEFGTGFLYCKMDQWEKGMPLVNKAMLLSPTYPRLYHLAPFLDFYRQGKYKQALFEAKKVSTPNTMHGPLARCISYAQLGEMDKAENEFQAVKLIDSRFMEIGKKKLTRYLGNEFLVEKIWDGVKKFSDSDM